MRSSEAIGDQHRDNSWPCGQAVVAPSTAVALAKADAGPQRYHDPHSPVCPTRDTWRDHAVDPYRVVSGGLFGVHDPPGRSRRRSLPCVRCAADPAAQQGRAGDRRRRRLDVGAESHRARPDAGTEARGAAGERARRHRRRNAADSRPDRRRRRDGQPRGRRRSRRAQRARGRHRRRRFDHGSAARIGPAANLRGPRRAPRAPHAEVCRGVRIASGAARAHGLHSGIAARSGRGVRSVAPVCLRRTPAARVAEGRRTASATTPGAE